MPGSPFPSQPNQEFLTIRVSKLAVANGLLAVIVVVALVALGFRERPKSQTPLTSALVASHPQEPAAVSPPSGRPARARAEAIAAQRTESEPSDPLPPVESQAPNEGAVESSASPHPEVLLAQLQPRQAVYREPLATDSADTQPEVKPEDSPQPADRPDPPAAPPPATPNPPSPRPVSASPTTLNGAGATYPYPLYSKWFDDFHELNPQVQINYQSVGSGAGVRDLLEGLVDFGATDAPVFGERLSHAKTPLVYIPTVLGAIVPFYNIPGISREIWFTPEILAAIYLGKIVSWNDLAIANVNRGANLPDLPIVVIHRAEGNGATFVFTDYLSKVSPEWQQKVGKGSSVNWPVGLGAKGDEGVAGLIRQIPGAIGYADLVYVEQNHMLSGRVGNAAGNFVKASLRSVTEAAASVSELPPNSGISITNAPGKDAYPIASFTWFLVPQKLPDPAKSQDLAAFLRWTATGGQHQAENLGYAPLPGKVIAQVLKIIAQLR